MERAGTEVTDWRALSAGRPYEWAIEAWSLSNVNTLHTGVSAFYIQEIFGIIVLRAVVLTVLEKEGFIVECIPISKQLGGHDRSVSSVPVDSLQTLLPCRMRVRQTLQL